MIRRIRCTGSGMGWSIPDGEAGLVDFGIRTFQAMTQAIVKSQPGPVGTHYL